MEHARTVSNMADADPRPRFTPRQTDQINVALARVCYARNRWQHKPTHKRYDALQHEQSGLTNLLRSIMGNHITLALVEQQFRQAELDRLPVTTRICACGQPESIGAGMDATTCENCGNEITRDNPEPGQDPNAAPERFDVTCPRCGVLNRYPGGFPAGACGQCGADLSAVPPDASVIDAGARAAQIRADYPQWSHIQIVDKIRAELRAADAGDRRTLSRPSLAPADFEWSEEEYRAVGKIRRPEPSVSADLAGATPTERAAEVIRRYLFDTFVERCTQGLVFDADEERDWMLGQFADELDMRAGVGARPGWTPWLSGLRDDDLHAGVELLRSWDWRAATAPPATRDNPPGNQS